MAPLVACNLLMEFDVRRQAWTFEDGPMQKIMADLRLSSAEERGRDREERNYVEEVPAKRRKIAA